MLVPYFMSWNKRSQKCSILTKKCISFKLCAQCLYIPVNQHFSFAKIIHSLDSCGILRSWLNSLITTQVYLVLWTIKGHSKMCTFVTQHKSTDVSCFEGASQTQTTCNQARPGPPPLASSPSGSSETSHPDSWLNWRVFLSVMYTIPGIVACCVYILVQYINIYFSTSISPIFSPLILQTQKDPSMWNEQIIGWH